MPLPGVDAPATPGTPPAAPAYRKPTPRGLADLMSTLGGGAPLLDAGLPMGGTGTPLGGLAGLTPQNAAVGPGNPGGRSASPPVLRTDAVEPLTRAWMRRQTATPRRRRSRR